jgi:branched-chain amino acid transport system substrate-binding protein
LLLLLVNHYLSDNYILRMIPKNLRKPAGFCRFALFITLVILFPFALPAQGEIKIGLLIPNVKSVAARQGAELAIQHTNRQGGYHGKKFRLVIRSMEGPWGTGSTQAIDLIFSEKVAAILVSNDGRNAHLAEQAITKTQVPMVSALSPDPTLSQAFVPWFFTCVPNTLQQGAALVKDIYATRKYKKTALIVDNLYDSKSAETGFIRMVKETKSPEPSVFTIQTDKEIPELAHKLKSAGYQAIVLFCEPTLALKVLRQVRLEKIPAPVFGSSLLIDEDLLTHREISEFNHAVWFALGIWSGPTHDRFVKEYVFTFKQNPGPVAAFAYDGMHAILEAIKKAGTERSDMQQALMNLKFTGATGPVGFDNKGNRTGSFSLVRLHEGLPETQ